MRYYIRAYPMHEHEVGAIQKEVDGGAIDARIEHSLIEGVADEAAIARLAAQGVVIQALAAVPAPARRRRGPAPAALVPPRSSGGYWLAGLRGGPSESALEALEAVGVEIVEPGPAGDYVLRGQEDGTRLAALPFVADLTPYGPDTTLDASSNLFALDQPSRTRRGPAATEGAVSVAAPAPQPDDAAPAVVLLEAMCHRAADRARVAQAIEQLGGTVVGGEDRVARFVISRASIDEVAAIPGVASLSGPDAPRLLTDHARPLVGLREPAGPPAAAALAFDGAGELAGVADTGIDLAHPDFLGGKRVQAVALGRRGDPSDPAGHGTHVAGTIVGTGRASAPDGAPLGPLHGVAPAADLYFQSVLDINGGMGGLPVSLADLFQPAYDAGVRVHNNSWGAYVQARYDGMGYGLDKFVAAHPDFLAVIAAGNEATCRNPLQRGPRGFVDYPSLGSPASAKNGLTVGASRSDRTEFGLSALRWGEVWPDDFFDDPIAAETISSDPACLAAFSSRGPVEDYRIKPDVVAPGTDIAAARSSDAPLAEFWGAYPRNRHYAFMGGTSMASPVVAGCALLARQYYRRDRAYDHPSAALLKATLINGATPLDGACAIADPRGNPNYHQGHGRIDMSRTLPDPAAPAFDLFFVDTWNRDPAERITSRLTRLRWAIPIAAPGEIRVTLAWTDPAGPGLFNKFRLILDTPDPNDPNGTSLNWIANGQAVAPLRFAAHDPRELLPDHANVVTRDPQNNVQKIRADLQPGTYTLALFADVLLEPPQDFALVVTYPAGGAGFSRREG